MELHHPPTFRAFSRQRVTNSRSLDENDKSIPAQAEGPAQRTPPSVSAQQPCVPSSASTSESKNALEGLLSLSLRGRLTQLSLDAFQALSVLQVLLLSSALSPGASQKPLRFVWTLQ